MIILPEFKGNNIKVYLSDGVFAGIYGYDEVSHSYKPKKCSLSNKSRKRVIVCYMLKIKTLFQKKIQ